MNSFANNLTAADMVARHLISERVADAQARTEVRQIRAARRAARRAANQQARRTRAPRATSCRCGPSASPSRCADEARAPSTATRAGPRLPARPALCRVRGVILRCHSHNQRFVWEDAHMTAMQDGPIGPPPEPAGSERAAALMRHAQRVADELQARAEEEAHGTRRGGAEPA